MDKNKGDGVDLEQVNWKWNGTDWQMSEHAQNARIHKLPYQMSVRSEQN